MEEKIVKTESSLSEVSAMLIILALEILAE